MPPTWKTIAATWLSPGHPGPLCFHMGCRQHSLLAIKIAEDKRQAASTSWQILICKRAFLICSCCFFPPLKTREFISEKLNKGIYFRGICFISEEINLKPSLDIIVSQNTINQSGELCLGGLYYSAFSLKLQPLHSLSALSYHRSLNLSQYSSDQANI